MLIEILKAEAIYLNETLSQTEEKKPNYFKSMKRSLQRLFKVEQTILTTLILFYKFNGLHGSKLFSIRFL